MSGHGCERGEWRGLGQVAMKERKKKRGDNERDETRRSVVWHGMASVTVTKGDGVHGESSVRDQRAHMQRRAAG